MKLNKYIVIGLISVTLISLELVWTRIFSAEFFYTFAFLILSLAILGLGLGSLMHRFFKGLGKEKNIGNILSIAGLFALTGPWLVFQLAMDFSLLFAEFSMVLKLAVIILLLSAPYFLGGIAIAYYFRSDTPDMPRMYMSDMVGAGLGVAFALFFMHNTGTPYTAFLSTLPLLIAAFMVSKNYWKIVPVILAVYMLVLGNFSMDLLEADKDEPAPVIYKHWDAMSKVKIYKYNEYYRGINIDNHASTTVVKFDGNFDNPDLEKYDYFGINVGYLVRKFDKCTFLALGSGGGKDVMHALHEGADQVHAVEVNPHINYLMTEGTLADFTGHLYKDDRIKVVTEDARAYVRRFEDKFDIIFSFSSNSYAALASGAFALAENYIYTTEAFIDYWEALTESGYLIMEHHFYVPRFISMARKALKELGVENFEEHIAVYKMPEWRRQLLLLSKKPLDRETIENAIGGLGPQHHNIFLQYPPADKRENNVIDRIVENGWREVQPDVKYDISPVSDDDPFAPQMGLWKNFSFDRLEKVEAFEEFFGFPLAKMIIVIVLLVVVVLIVPINILPYITKGKKLKPGAWLYFFSIGMAFMMVEIILIQKYTLFIGASVYSIATILLTLLISTGIGSRFAGKLDIKIAFIVLIALLLIEIFVFEHLIYALGDLVLIPRILITAVLLAPLGFFMGMPFPKGAMIVGELVDWGFAINGAASVLGSTLIILTAISFGFTMSLLIALGFYVIAFLLFLKRKL